MKRFIYPSPFPTPPIERQLPEEQVSLGPFTLAEAVRIFWSLKSLDLDMSLTVNYATEYGDPLNIKAHYNDLHPSADSIAAREPYRRCTAPPLSILTMERDQYTPHYGFTLEYPIMLPQENPSDDYADRMFAFPLDIYFGEELVLLSSHSLYGPDHLLDLAGTVPITIFSLSR